MIKCFCNNVWRFREFKKFTIFDLQLEVAILGVTLIGGEFIIISQPPGFNISLVLFGICFGVVYIKEIGS